jgi:hypothetical protein
MIQVSAIHFTEIPENTDGGEVATNFFQFSKTPYFRGQNQFLPLFGIKKNYWWCLQTHVFVVLIVFFFFFLFIYYFFPTFLFFVGDLRFFVIARTL